MKTDNEIYKTKYPIVFVHGFGYRDDSSDKYWGRIPQIMREYGNEVYFGHQDGYAGLIDNAAALKKRIMAIERETNAESVNIIAHSKGGLEARYMISELGMADKISSLTTLSTPHGGSYIMDKVMAAPKILKTIFGVSVNTIQRLRGDKNPNTVRALEELTEDYLKVFNELVKDSDKVYYQSYAFYMKSSADDLLLMIPYNIYRDIGDGLVTSDSARWGAFKGTFTSYGNKGISHRGATDTFKRPFAKGTKNGSSGKGKADEQASGQQEVDKQAINAKQEKDMHQIEEVGDIAELYLRIVADLRKRGY